MVQIPRVALGSLRDGIASAGLTVGHFEAACRSLVDDAPAEAQAQVESAARRLHALRRDLEGRLRAEATQDACYVGLTVLQAALVCLADAVREMRAGYDATQPRQLDRPGWFIDPEDADLR
jgi:hypothetical protein